MKSSGSALFISLFLLTFVLIAGASLLYVLGKNAQNNAEIFFTEKSFFAAESGIEESLLFFKKNPVQFFSGDFVFDDANVSLHTGNVASAFSVLLAPESATRFFLKKDIDPTERLEIVSPRNFSFSSSHSDFFWKILCRNSEGTFALQDFAHVVPNQQHSFFDFVGNYDDAVGHPSVRISVLDFFQNRVPDSVQAPFLSSLDVQSCFFSVTNLSVSQPLMLDFEAAAGDVLMRDTFFIESIGRFAGKQKKITFEYKPTNLSLFFDFGFLQKD